MGGRAADFQDTAFTPVKRLLLAAVVTMLALLLVEGAYSAATGRSLRSLRGVAARLPALSPGGQRLEGDGTPSAPAGGGAPAPVPLTEAERHAGAEHGAGLYQIHEDPRVRYVLRARSKLSIGEGEVRTDHLGMRVRPGPPAPADALRIAVVGDSVAFGSGVSDHEAEAAQLERLLASTRGPDARPIACFTVAVPSWNHRNPLAFLTDHWNELRPDIVIYVPVMNDLGDAGGVWESGRLRQDADPSQPDPWLYASRIHVSAIEAALAARPDWKMPDEAALGPFAIEADLTPESRRRYDENAMSILAMDRLAAAHGSRLLVTHSGQSSCVWHLTARLQRLAPHLPVVFLESKSKP